jgi:hypothetical protein
MLVAVAVQGQFKVLLMELVVTVVEVLVEIPQLLELLIQVAVLEVK